MATNDSALPREPSPNTGDFLQMTPEDRRRPAADSDDHRDNKDSGQGPARGNVNSNSAIPSPDGGEDRQDRPAAPTRLAKYRSEYDPTFTGRVIAATGPNANPRLASVMPSLVRHLHEFAREVGLTVDEWMAGVEMVRGMSSSLYFISNLCPPPS